MPTNKQPPKNQAVGAVTLTTVATLAMIGSVVAVVSLTANDAHSPTVRGFLIGMGVAALSSFITGLVVRHLHKSGSMN